jgi:hypothetical protein
MAFNNGISVALMNGMFRTLLEVLLNNSIGLRYCMHRSMPAVLYDHYGVVWLDT